MHDHETRQQYWSMRIRHDLASFAAPNSEIALEIQGKNISVVWETPRKRRQDTFTIARDAVHRVTGKTREPYDRFIAGPDMADLRSVARMIQRASTARLYVPTRAKTETSEPADAISLLQELLAAEGDIDATRLIMITGEAGCGKTQVLQEFVRNQASAYLEARSHRLLLYVNAQGRALARLNEALATELQDLRVGLTYHSVATLTRLGLLVPVIDGFDELLGVSGYDDAFSSLAVFLDDLQGEGQIVTSARSVYYEEEFRTRAIRSSTTAGRWEDIPVQICSWSNSEQTKYIQKLSEQRRLPKSRARKLERQVLNVFAGRDSNLVSKPFFLTRTAELLLDDHALVAGEDMLEQVVNAFLQREQSDKLRDRQDTPLLSFEQLRLVLSELALEMWNQETRELDKRSVQEVAEYVLATNDVSESSQQILIERVPSMASLVRAPTGSGIAFEHESFFFYFLTQALVAQYFVQASDLRVVLGRSSLPDDVAIRVASILLEGDGEDRRYLLQNWLDRLGSVASKNWLRAAQVRQNAGLLVLALLREFAHSEGELTDLQITSVAFPGSHLRGVTFRRCAFRKLEFRRTDLTDTRFLECRVDDVMLIEPRVSEATRLELQGLDSGRQISGLYVVGGTSNPVYNPFDVARIVLERGGPSQEEDDEGPQVSAGLAGLVERLMRAYSRTNALCIDEERYKGIRTDRNWSVVLDQLLRHRIVSEESRPMKGTTRRTAKHFLRREVLPAELMAGLSGAGLSSPPVRAFWRSLSELDS